MEKKLQNIYVRYCNLLIKQDLWQAHHQILWKKFSEPIHRTKCKYRHDDKKCEICGIIYKHCECFLEYTNLIDDLIECKCFCCNKSYQQKFDKKVERTIFNTYKFSNNGNNKFILLLQEGIYPYKHMDDRETFNETSLPEKDDFYSPLNIKHITDADYAHAKTVCKDLETKMLWEYHDFYGQSSTLLLADVFENFRNTFLKIYELDPAKFISAPGIAWQAALRKTKVKLDL